MQRMIASRKATPILTLTGMVLGSVMATALIASMLFG